MNKKLLASVSVLTLLTAPLEAKAAAITHDINVDTAISIGAIINGVAIANNDNIRLDGDITVDITGDMPLGFIGVKNPNQGVLKVTGGDHTLSIANIGDDKAYLKQIDTTNCMFILDNDSTIFVNQIKGTSIVDYGYINFAYMKSILNLNLIENSKLIIEESPDLILNLRSINNKNLTLHSLTELNLKTLNFDSDVNLSIKSSKIPRICNIDDGINVNNLNNQSQIILLDDITINTPGIGDKNHSLGAIDVNGKNLAFGEDATLWITDIKNSIQIGKPVPIDFKSCEIDLNLGLSVANYITPSNSEDVTLNLNGENSLTLHTTLNNLSFYEINFNKNASLLLSNDDPLLSTTLTVPEGINNSDKGKLDFLTSFNLKVPHLGSKDHYLERISFKDNMKFENDCKIWSKSLINSKNAVLGVDIDAGSHKLELNLRDNNVVFNNLLNFKNSIINSTSINIMVFNQDVILDAINILGERTVINFNKNNQSFEGNINGLSLLSIPNNNTISFKGKLEDSNVTFADNGTLKILESAEDVILGDIKAIKGGGNIEFNQSAEIDKVGTPAHKLNKLSVIAGALADTDLIINKTMEVKNIILNSSNTHDVSLRFLGDDINSYIYKEGNLGISSFSLKKANLSSNLGEGGALDKLIIEEKLNIKGATKIVVNENDGKNQGIYFKSNAGLTLENNLTIKNSDNVNFEENNLIDLSTHHLVLENGAKLKNGTIKFVLVDNTKTSDHGQIIVNKNSLSLQGTTTIMVPDLSGSLINDDSDPEIDIKIVAGSVTGDTSNIVLDKAIESSLLREWKAIVENNSLMLTARNRSSAEIRKEIEKQTANSPSISIEDVEKFESFFNEALKSSNKELRTFTNNNGEYGLEEIVLYAVKPGNAVEVQPFFQNNNFASQVVSRVTSALISNASPAAGDEVKARSLWAELFGSRVNQAAYKTNPAYNVDLVGMSCGIDAEFNDRDIFGISFSVIKSYVDFTSKGAKDDKVRASTYVYSLYGAHKIHSNLLITDYISFSTTNVDSTIYKALPNNPNGKAIIAKSTQQINQFALGANMNYRYDLKNDISFTPHLGFDFLRSLSGGFKENISSIPNYANPQNLAKTFSSSGAKNIINVNIGADLNRVIVKQNMIIIPEIGVSYQQDIVSKENKVNTSVLGMSPTTNKSPIPPQSALIFKGGIEIKDNAFYEIGINYTYTIKHSVRERSAALKLKINL